MRLAKALDQTNPDQDTTPLDKVHTPGAHTERIANVEARSISQVCELLLSEGAESYKKDGPKFIQRLVAKQKARVKVS